MHAEIITIGTELTSGRRVDTNAAFIARELATLGIVVTRHTSVADDADELAGLLRAAAARSDVAIVTGGLGPTADDVTREALAAAGGGALVTDSESVARIRERFKRYGRTPSPSNMKQAMCPAGAEALPNPLGTAPGVAIRIGDCRMFAVPGVPSEMKGMLRDAVIPRLPRSGRVTVEITLNIFGVPESTAGETCAEWMASGSVPLVGITAEDYILKIVVTAFGTDRDAAQAIAQPVADTIASRLGDAVFGYGGVTIQEAVARAVRDRGLTLATAESCTGGLVAHRITNVPGASAFFLQGIVAYTNEAKRAQLGVPEALIREHGAVSEPVARAMAEGVRRVAGASFGVGVTGIAGPTGGTPEKPVGLVHAAVAGKTTRAARFMIHGDRQQVQDRAAKCVLNLLRLHLLAIT